MTEFIRNKLTINHFMKMKVDHDNEKLLFEGKNNWFAVMINRMIVLTACILIGFLIPSEPKAMRIVGGLMVLIPVLVFIESLIKSKSPKLQKTFIAFGRNQISFTHEKDQTALTELFQNDIENLTIFYKIEAVTTELKFYLNHSETPLFDFIVDEKIKPKKLFQLFGRQSQYLGLSKFIATPSRSRIGKITFSRSQGIDFDINESFKDQKKQSLDHQYTQRFNQTRVGNYVLTSKADEIHIDLKSTTSEWFVTAVGMLIAIGLFSFPFIIEAFGVEEISTGIRWFLRIGGAVFAWICMHRIYSEYFELYILDLKNQKLKIRNVFLQLKEIDFSSIDTIHLKGEISRSSNRRGGETETFSASIELEAHDGEEHVLIHISPTYFGSDENLIKDSIYADGMNLTQLIAFRMGVRSKWHDFKEYPD